jgi:hypothetical protein
MQRLNVDAAAWREAMRPSGNVFGRILGRLDHLQRHAQSLGQSPIQGFRQADRFFSDTGGIPALVADPVSSAGTPRWTTQVPVDSPSVLPSPSFIQ